MAATGNPLRHGRVREAPRITVAAMGRSYMEILPLCNNGGGGEGVESASPATAGEPT